MLIGCREIHWVQEVYSTLLVAYCTVVNYKYYDDDELVCLHVQVAGHTAMPTLVSAVDRSSWMMFTVPQVPASY